MKYSKFLYILKKISNRLINIKIEIKYIIYIIFVKVTKIKKILIPVNQIYVELFEEYNSIEKVKMLFFLITRNYFYNQRV